MARFSIIGLVVLALGGAAWASSVRQFINHDLVDYDYTYSCGCGRAVGMIPATAQRGLSDGCDDRYDCKLVVQGAGSLTISKDDRRNIHIKGGSLSLR